MKGVVQEWYWERVRFRSVQIETTAPVRRGPVNPSSACEGTMAEGETMRGDGVVEEARRWRRLFLRVICDDDVV